MSVANSTRVVAGISVVFYIVAFAISSYIVLVQIPVLRAEILGGGGIEVVGLLLIMLYFISLGICGVIFITLNIAASRSPVKKRNWFKGVGIAALAIPVITLFLYVIASGPLALGGIMDLIAWAIVRKGKG